MPLQLLLQIQQAPQRNCRQEVQLLVTSITNLLAVADGLSGDDEPLRQVSSKDEQEQKELAETKEDLDQLSSKETERDKEEKKHHKKKKDKQISTSASASGDDVGEQKDKKPKKKKEKDQLQFGSDLPQISSVALSTTSVNSASASLNSSSTSSSPFFSVGSPSQNNTLMQIASNPPKNAVHNNSVAPAASTPSPCKLLSDQFLLTFDVVSEHVLGNHVAFGELWEKKAKRIKTESPHGSTERWRMLPLIVKAGEEVLQEEVTESVTLD